MDKRKKFHREQAMFERIYFEQIFLYFIQNSIPNSNIKIFNIF